MNPDFGNPQFTELSNRLSYDFCCRTGDKGSLAGGDRLPSAARDGSRNREPFEGLR